MILHIEDPAYPTEADAEILGQGTLLCLIIVTPMILLAYAVEGRKTVQQTSLDCLFSFAGACLLIAVGGNVVYNLATRWLSMQNRYARQLTTSMNQNKLKY